MDTPSRSSTRKFLVAASTATRAGRRWRAAMSLWSTLPSGGAWVDRESQGCPPGGPRGVYPTRREHGRSPGGGRVLHLLWPCAQVSGYPPVQARPNITCWNSVRLPVNDFGPGLPGLRPNESSQLPAERGRCGSACRGADPTPGRPIPPPWPPPQGSIVPMSRSPSSSSRASARTGASTNRPINEPLMGLLSLHDTGEAG